MTDPNAIEPNAIEPTVTEPTVSRDGSAVRLEHDGMGEVAVAVTALWGAQTQRAVENFPISGERLGPGLIRALALIKAEAARANQALGRLGAAEADAIVAAAEAVAGGRHAEHFPVDVFQTGSGTSSNMNMNEVIANLAARHHGVVVHPNDQVNASQSSNDVFPSAVQLAAASAVQIELLPALGALHAALEAKAGQFATVVKAGRTHLMDATPVTLGQEFGGYAVQVADARARLGSALPRVGRLPLGGTATGTGLNCPPGFASQVIAALAARTGLELSEATDHFAAQSCCDGLVELSAALRGLAISMVKIANDLRWMASGPRTGLAEIHLPDLQPGSSIMPGKVNPVLPEVVVQVAAQLVGNDAAVAFAASQGAFELITCLPVVARNVLSSISLAANTCGVFADRCVAGIEADVERCRRYAERTAQVAAVLNPRLGYDVVATLVDEMQRTGRPIRDLVVERGLLEPAELDAMLDLLALTRGG